MGIYPGVCVLPSPCLGINLAYLLSPLIRDPQLTTCRPLALSMAVCDAIKNYREGKDLLD